MANVVEPDAGTANQSQVPLTLGSPTNLSQDFGYRPSQDARQHQRPDLEEIVNADGVYDPDGVDNVASNADDETAIVGVTVDLYHDI